MLSWIDGQSAEALSARDRGLAYGDGLFETIRVSAGRPRLLARHLARLGEGVRRLCLPVSLDLVEDELLRFSAALGDGVAKLMLTRGDGARGYAPQADARVRRVLLASPVPAYPDKNREEGVKLFPCASRLAEQPLLAGLKHLNRLEQVLARAEWSDPAFAEGLMRDVSGRVIEGVFSNLFLVRGGQLITAELTRCGVAGVMRAELLDRAPELGMPVIVRDIDFAELQQADEVFLCNSLYGIWPVRSAAGHAWPVGPLTRKLQGQLRELLDS
ncbi:aminodeoxychorismate lyase [Pseudomonas sp. ZM23]|uniref:Aminodeoxychorismate lyase n=1 Tax=Pseudomonas triclosanedens TaxID=2961893 RepID=A0ABY6ZSZ7_9PSED|nr:aminodeoxychorismate lyase [Pseudomonas triclosanedens]MCP8466732.1 aminodeoxychorismate lyase [Pseudomonas triclosanedens]MCP8471913.1 aminodeoxychorismate lyase [Pseudomonas triclosanedens]MCP8474703.1 aminodeoxychorismate lyase [Pseudomonas triclosanedens]WAI47926.1 aminodeoxychorismate lyase [Pseudomonas triclosanedens]